ncbi:MAG: VWA domain-containing protein, partial [Holophagales bacterium]|nr:VWA domain-containing protein [Holophagales bacterium]
MMIGAILLGAVLALGTPPGPTMAAEAGQEVPLGRGVGELSDVVEVTVVNVDVVATDRNGRPADDLSRQNFRVFDNGAPVELSYFSRGGGGGDPDPELVHEPLSIAFFFDNTHLSVASRSAVMDQIKDFARGQLEAEDRDVPVYAMVVAYDGELRLLQDLTTDYIALAQGLNRAEAAHQVFTEAQGLKRRSQESFLQLMDQLNARRQESAGSIGALRATLAELLAYARVVHQDSARTADAIEEVVDSLALVPGRKAFFLISDGFAARPFDRLLQNVQKRVAGRREETGIELMQSREVDGPEGFDAPNNLYTRNSNIQGTAALSATSFQQHLSAFDLSDRYAGLAALANSHRVSFYSFKPPEVEVAAAALSERVSDQQKLTYLSDLRGVLNGLAHDTGGRAWVSGRNVAAFFDQVAADLRSYYSLGYILDEFVEGSIHDVRIRTRPRNLRLRHRTSYVARSLRERLAERTVGALLLGWTENPHG